MGGTELKIVEGIMVWELKGRGERIGECSRIPDREEETD